MRKFTYTRISIPADEKGFGSSRFSEVEETYEAQDYVAMIRNEGLLIHFFRLAGDRLTISLIVDRVLKISETG
jgi:hypothetical protein